MKTVREYFIRSFRSFRSLGLVLCLAICLTASSGCIYLIVGGVGAVGGYIVSPDTVEGLTDHDEVAVWNAAKEIVSIMGLVVAEHDAGGFLEAKISGAQVTINIVSVNGSTVKVSVKARKAFLPRISIAQDVFVKIMNELEM